MATYICKINSTAGRIGQKIDRDPQSESTKQLLERGLIYEAKVVELKETKSTKPKRNKAK